MSRWFTLVFQGLGFAAQLAAPFIVNPHSVAVLHTVIGGVQVMQAVAAHSYNPDGTPAQVAYTAGK